MPKVIDQITDWRERPPRARRLVNWQIPVHIAEAINRLAKDLGRTKTEVVIGLLRTALEQTGKIKKK